MGLGFQSGMSLVSLLWSAVPVDRGYGRFPGV